MALVVGLIVWVLLEPRSRDPWKVLALILVFTVEPVTKWVMAQESRLIPVRYDYFLQSIDRALGITAFQIARALNGAAGLLFALYESLSLVMVLWYVVNLKVRDGQPRQLLFAYLAAFGIAPALYLVVPACGPRHAFGVHFPQGDPNPTLSLIRLDGWPNAIPSLHLTAALLLVFFSGRNRFFRTLAALFAIATAASTLVLEHYVIDLVAGAAYACFAAMLAQGRLRRAAGFGRFFGVAGRNPVGFTVPDRLDWRATVIRDRYRFGGFIGGSLSWRGATQCTAAKPMAYCRAAEFR